MRSLLNAARHVQLVLCLQSSDFTSCSALVVVLGHVVSAGGVLRAGVPVVPPRPYHSLYVQLVDLLLCNLCDPARPRSDVWRPQALKICWFSL